MIIFGKLNGCPFKEFFSVASINGNIRCHVVTSQYNPTEVQGKPKEIFGIENRIERKIWLGFR